MITFSCKTIDDVRVLLDSTPAKIVDGYGGWDTVDRPRKKALTQWNGRNPFRMQIPILFDGYRSSQGQEIAISRLSRMALPPTGNTGEPPIVQVSGPGLPNPGPVDWVIDSLVWGDNVIIDLIGGVSVRTRQDAIVTLLEYVDPTHEAFKNLPGLTVTSGKKKVPTRVTVKHGQTLQQIAVTWYGTASKAKDIAKANNIRDWKRLPQSLRLP